jgi:hypothetical protein
MDAPLGKAVLGKSAQDEVAISTPGGERRFAIVAISYERAEGKKMPGTRPGQSQGEN